VADAKDQKKVAGFRYQVSAFLLETRELIRSTVASAAAEACSLRPETYNRADDGLRTRDLQLGKLALYQLSYVRARRHFSMPDVTPVH
jgi:hypothetical protein